MIKKNFFYLFVILLFLPFSCEQKSLKSQLVGSWQLVNFTTNQNTTKDANYLRVAKHLIITTSMDINNDGTIDSYIWGQKLTGKWKLKGDKFIVTTKQGKPFVAKIIKLNAEQLLIYSQQDSIKVLLYFRRDLL